jgi:hypothetical protein
VQQCDPIADRNFELVEDAFIRSLRTKLCLNVESGGTNDGTRVVEWDCDGASSELPLHARMWHQQTCLTHEPN